MKFPKFMKYVSLLIPLLLLGIGASTSFSKTLFAAAGNPIVTENQNPGSTGWQIDYNNGSLANDTEGQIKGYASAVSINKGQSINFHVSVNPAQTYQIDVYRMGWYNGAGGRLMLQSGTLNGTKQPDCPMDAQTGMIECNWAVAYTLAVPTSWTTGIYLAKLTNAANVQSYIIFTVRDDGRIADFLYQQPVTTYQAYNNYPADGARGKSLYDFNSYGPNTGFGTRRAVKVSFDRPYGGNGGADGGGQFADNIFWERYFISWTERMGYDISYVTDLDVHLNGARLLNYKGFLSVGHDEYWSKPMRDAVETARDAGVHLGFFNANTAYWQIRFEPSTGGAENRVVVSYKDASLDPVGDPALKTILWRDVNRAEQALVGVQFVVGSSDIEITSSYAVQNSNHWVWSNSGFTDGSVVPGITGYEVDRLFDNYPTPVSLSYTKLASSPFQGDTAESSIYQAPSGAWVFGAGTSSWGWALDRPNYVNPGIQQATKNILDRFLQGRAVPTPTNTPAPTNTPTPTITPVASCSGRITSLRLWNLGANTAVAGYDPIPNGATIFLQDLPANFTIDARTSGTIGSMKFAINNAAVIENAAPYRALGDATPWKPTAGAYTVDATVYKNSNATGGICDTKRLSVTIANRPNPTPTPPANGLNYEYYEGNWNSLPNFNFLTPRNTGINNNFNLNPSHRADNFAFRFSGCMDVPSLGIYTFFTKSDDGSKLYIDGLQVVNNDGAHGVQERFGFVIMPKGRHSIMGTYFEAGGSEAFEVRYQGPGISKKLIPDNVLTHGTCYVISAAQLVDSGDPEGTELDKQIFLPLITSTTQ